MHKGEASQGTSCPLINVNVWNKKGTTLGRDAYLFNPVTNGNPSLRLFVGNDNSGRGVKGETIGAKNYRNNPTG